MKQTTSPHEEEERNKRRVNQFPLMCYFFQLLESNLCTHQASHARALSAFFYTLVGLFEQLLALSLAH